MSQVQILYLNKELNEMCVNDIESRVMDFISKGDSRIILAAEQVDKVDWPSVGRILGLKRILRQFEGDIKLAGLPPSVEEPFCRSGANEILEMYTTINEALDSFEKYSDDLHC